MILSKRGMIMKFYTEKQGKVIEAVKAWGADKKWFRGVCTDNMPGDPEIDEDFDGAVLQVCMETAYWDAPDFCNP